MEFEFSYKNLSKLDKILQRFFEILPAAISWTILLALTVVCFVRPLIAAVITIAFSFYWFLRLLYMAISFVLRCSRLELESQANWPERARGLNRIYTYWKELNDLEAASKTKQDISFLIHRKEMRLLEKSKQKAPQLDDIHHLIIIPVSDNQENLISKTVTSLIGGNFPSIRMVVVLAFEPGVSENAKLSNRRLIERYRDKFFDFLTVACSAESQTGKSFKGAILSQAASQAANYFKEKKIAHENVITSSLEPGALVNPDHYSCLTYRFMVLPSRQLACFQAIAAYDVSLWRASAPGRVLNAAASFFQIIEAVHPDNLIIFSSFSVSLATLLELKFWPSDLISADLSFFWKAFINFNGAFTINPLYVTYPITMDIAGDSSDSVSELYKKKCNLAYAGENLPIVMRALLRIGRMPFLKKIICAFKLLEAQILPAVWPFIIFIIGWLPALLSGREFSDSGIYYSAPRITFVIFALMTACFIISIVLTSLVFPRKKSKLGFFNQISQFFALIFLVPVGIFLTAAATLSVQTNLMLGKHPKPQ
ncbi:MAG: hypothetical protein K9L86_07150 [Candidatus Omnitrophica bacterium]|nr:hypothetical protein [Candidatus Omnitrophota bacterium]